MLATKWTFNPTNQNAHGVSHTLSLSRHCSLGIKVWIFNIRSYINSYYISSKKKKDINQNYFMDIYECLNI